MKSHQSDCDHSDEHDHSHNHSFIHGHSHNSHEIVIKEPTRAFQISILVNFLFVLVEFYYGFISNSLSLVADAGHNLGDVFALLLAWAGFYLAKSRSTVRFNFGFKKVSILAALLNAVFLVGTSFYIIYEAVMRFYNPTQIEDSQNAMIIVLVAALGIVINFSTALLFHRHQKEDLNLKSAYLHLLGDALVSLGVVIGGLLIYWKGWLAVDTVISVAIAFLLFFGTWGLLKESVIMVLNGVPSSLNLTEIEKFFIQNKSVKKINELKVWAVGTSEYALTAKIVLDKNINFEMDHFQDDLTEQFKIKNITIQVDSV